MSDFPLNAAVDFMLVKAEMVKAADRYRSWFGLEGHEELVSLIKLAQHPSELAHAARRIGEARRATKP